MKRLPVLLALAGVLALSVLGVAQAQVVPAEQHFYATVHTDFFGNATLDLQDAVTKADVVVKVASGATNLGGEDPSFATVNFAGFVDAGATADTIRVRVIGWHANTVTGNAEFRYYSNKDVRIAVDVYPRTA